LGELMFMLCVCVTVMLVFAVIFGYEGTFFITYLNMNSP
jgi:hypothetical protein